MFNDIVDLHVPMKEARVRSKSLLWIIRKICVLMRARTYHLRKVKKNRKFKDWAKFKTIRNQLKKYMRKAKPGQKAGILYL